VLTAYPNLVVMRTLSKIGMAGLRVGYTISAPAIAAVLEKLRPPYNLSALDQRAAEVMLEHGAAWCAARAHDVVVERARLAAGLATRASRCFPARRTSSSCARPTRSRSGSGSPTRASACAGSMPAGSRAACGSPSEPRPRPMRSSLRCESGPSGADGVRRRRAAAIERSEGRTEVDDEALAVEG